MPAPCFADDAPSNQSPDRSIPILLSTPASRRHSNCRARASPTVAAACAPRRDAPVPAGSIDRPRRVIDATARGRAREPGALGWSSRVRDDLIPGAFYLAHQCPNLGHDGGVVGCIGERQSAHHVNVQGTQILCDLTAPLYIKTGVEVIDQTDSLADGRSLGHDVAYRPIVLDALHASLSNRQMRQDVLEHDLHQP